MADLPLAQFLTRRNDMPAGYPATVMASSYPTCEVQSIPQQITCQSYEHEISGIDGLHALSPTNGELQL